MEHFSFKTTINVGLFDERTDHLRSNVTPYPKIGQVGFDYGFRHDDLDLIDSATPGRSVFTNLTAADARTLGRALVRAARKAEGK
jgi:hypothetical protein